MTVIQHQNGKWRVMDATGKHVLHAGNTPTNAAADGGGYATREEALAQLRAIERSKHGR